MNTSANKIEFMQGGRTNRVLEDRLQIIHNYLVLAKVISLCRNTEEETVSIEESRYKSVMDKAKAKNILQQGNYFLYQYI